MKTMPERTTKIKELIREALTKKYNCSPVERADRLYADVEYQFRKIHEQQVKNLNIPDGGNSIAIEYAEFCVRCDREKLPLLCLEDYIKQYCC